MYWDSLRYISAQAAYLAGSRDSGEAYCEVQYRARTRDLLAWADTAIWARGVLLPLRALRPVGHSLVQEDTAASPTENTLLLSGNAALLWREAVSDSRRPPSETGLSSDLWGGIRALCALRPQKGRLPRASGALVCRGFSALGSP